MAAVERVLRPVGPFRFLGRVVIGFQRGSKQLGWPTANLDPAAFEHALDDSEEGVYVGWAMIDSEKLPPGARVVHKAVLSIGWNPYYQNKQRTVEAYICHDFEGLDFYDASMRLLICGFLRPQANFASLEELKQAITGDVDFGKRQLDRSPMVEFSTDAFFPDDARGAPSSELVGVSGS